MVLELLALIMNFLANLPKTDTLDWENTRVTQHSDLF